MSKVRMISRKSRKEPLHDLATLQKLAAEASRRAVQKAEKSHVSAAYVKDGKLIMRNPDHSITEVKLLSDRPRLNAEDLVWQA